jgi:hypothetical protein
MDHPIAALDVGIKQLQGLIARHDEVLLHPHLHIREREQMAQPLAIAEEFSGDGVAQQLDVGHCQPRSFSSISVIGRCCKGPKMG